MGVLVAFVDGKRVAADILDIDVHAGWVEIEDLAPLKTAPEEEGKVEDEILSTSVALPRKKLTGKVIIKVLPDEI